MLKGIGARLYFIALSKSTSFLLRIEMARNLPMMLQLILMVFTTLFVLLRSMRFFFFFSIWILFHEHSRFTGQQGKGEGIYLTPLYHFHPLHRHLDISRAITTESSPLHIAGSRTRTGNRVYLLD